MAKRRIIYGIVPFRNEPNKKRWVPIGTAWVNRDGSERLDYDFFPARPDIDIQVRDPKPKEDQGDEGHDE